MNRFWEKVDIQSVDGCWNWLASKRANGRYGHFRVGNKMISAHRFAYILTNGDIPLGFQINHTCDNSLCCNPHHLEVGTQSQNNKDSYNRVRRTQQHEHNGNSKLSPIDVQKIRDTYANNDITYTSIGKQYGVSSRMISYIVKRENWV